MLQGDTETVTVEPKINKMLWLDFPQRETLHKAGVKNHGSLYNK